MGQLIKIDDEYAAWVREIHAQFHQCQLQNSIKVNVGMLHFYYALGKQIDEKIHQSQYGSALFRNLSLDLKDCMPDVKSFSETNLRYMARFYLLYKDCVENLPQVGAELISPNFAPVEHSIFAIPWGHHKYIIDKYKNDLNRALFYVRKTFENSWSRNVLLNFMDSDLYERQGKAV